MTTVASPAPGGGTQAPGEFSGMSDPRDMLDSEMSGRAVSPVLVGRGEQMAAVAAAAGARVLTGGCLQLGTDGLPYAPFTAVLRDLVHEMGADAVAALL